MCGPLRWKKGQEFLQTTRSELMQVRMPRRDQRNLQFVREHSTELTEFARTGDVNDVGTESFQGFARFAEMAPQKKVVTQIAFDAEAGPTARKLQMSEAAFLRLSYARARMNDEKRMLTALSERR
jgi:hypothetical protein